jgi:hypothetical protein
MGSHRSGGVDDDSDEDLKRNDEAEFKPVQSSASKGSQKQSKSGSVSQLVNLLLKLILTQASEISAGKL